MEVRQQFAAKLHKGLSSLRLPLRFMGIFMLAATDPVEGNAKTAAAYLLENVKLRRNIIAKSPSSSALRLLPGSHHSLLTLTDPAYPPQTPLPLQKTGLRCCPSTACRMPCTCWRTTTT